ncbi:MAG: hypothetical protein LC775_06040, partial [Acidobacteria bacterium]|nr:hypothetical protein [Acidobacteriota bacterium]
MRDTKKLKLLLVMCLAPLAVLLTRGSRAQPGETTVKEYREWKMFGGGPENIHYSSLRQINRENVSRLGVAWVYDTNDVFPGSEMQCNPVIADGVLYATT